MPITLAKIKRAAFQGSRGLHAAISYTISGGNSHSATTKNDDRDIILAVVTIGSRRVFRYKSEIGKVLALITGRI